MNIYEKIAAVMQDVAYLAKDDRVETGKGKGYKAITEEKVTSTVRASLIKNKLVIAPVKQEHRREDEKVTDTYGKEKINRITTVDVTYRIINTEKPEEYIDVVSSGTGVDTQDKGVGKAMTYAYKYMLLRVFAIPTGEDADKISSDLYDEKLYGHEYTPDKDFKEPDFQKQLDTVQLATEAQISEIRELLAALGQDENEFLQAKNAPCLDVFKEATAAEMIDKMRKRLGA